MVDPSTLAIIKQMDDAANLIAARIQKLIDAGTGATAAELAAVLQPEADKLVLLGQDPNNPVPNALKS